MTTACPIPHRPAPAGPDDPLVFATTADGSPAGFAITGERPHLILAGAAGSGLTAACRVISLEATRRLYTANGVIPGSVLIDGFVAGTWRLTRSRPGATVTIELFGPVRQIDTAQRDALAAEAGRVLAFGAPDAVHEVRFAPLQRAGRS